MTRDQLHFDELERLLRESLESVAKHLSDQDRSDVSEYLDHGEYGVAYELLAFVLDKQRLAWPVTLVEAGKKMGMVD
ncbi:hypothetical protein ACV229_16880 [Burkholderia sp. MR1-5-21]